MMKVNILERLVTGRGEFISIRIPDEVISVGDVILADNQEFTVKGIQFPTTPLQNQTVLLRIG